MWRREKDVDREEERGRREIETERLKEGEIDRGLGVEEKECVNTRGREFGDEREREKGERKERETETQRKRETEREKDANKIMKL